MSGIRADIFGELVGKRGKVGKWVEPLIEVHDVVRCHLVLGMFGKRFEGQAEVESVWFGICLDRRQSSRPVG